MSKYEGFNVVHVITEVLEELIRQKNKWGEQNHPWACADDEETNLTTWWQFTEMSPELAQAQVDQYAQLGTLTYADILMEEVVEALKETDQDRVVEELVQVAAVAISAALSMIRNGR